MDRETNVLLRGSDSAAASRAPSTPNAAAPMPVEGIWTYETYGAYGWEHPGILVLEKGRILGGDNRQYAVGRYSVSGNMFNAKFAIQFYRSPRTVFGEKREQYEIEFTGRVGDGVISGTATRPSRPQFSLDCRLIRQMDLPTA